MLFCLDFGKKAMIESRCEYNFTISMLRFGFYPINRNDDTENT